MKKMRLLAILLALVMVAAACGSDDDSSEGTDGSTDATTTTEEVDVTQTGDLTFYMITHSDDGPFWSVFKRGAEAAAEAVGVEMVGRARTTTPTYRPSSSTPRLLRALTASGCHFPTSTLCVPVSRLPLPLVFRSTPSTRGGTTIRTSEPPPTLVRPSSSLVRVLAALQRCWRNQDPLWSSGAGQRRLIERCDGVANTFSGDRRFRVHGSRRRSGSHRKQRSAPPWQPIPTSTASWAPARLSPCPVFVPYRPWP